jgi:biopolymer transport protein ExbD
MAIYAPGKRDRHNRTTGKAGRNIIMSLSLTAMVDMFTVLAVFLLQNYQTTGEVIEISDKVKLPQAHSVRELKPAHVITVSHENIMLDKEIIATFTQVKEQQDWIIEGLQKRLQEDFKASEEKLKLGLGTIKQAVDASKQQDQAQQIADSKRVTVQADKSIDFLTVKKVMYTLTEAGASEINFAVIKNEAKVQATN